MKPFAYDLEEREIKRERQKARELRQSQWWKRRCAKGRCHYCGMATPAADLTMDHIVPVARGGKTTKGNVVPACKTCNTKKKQLLPMEWDAYLQTIQRPEGDGSQNERSGHGQPPVKEEAAAADPLRALSDRGGPDALLSVDPKLVQAVRRTLIDQETSYQHSQSQTEFPSLWAHSARVGRIAHHIATAEGCDAVPALLAGLMHDMGKFAHGCYHPDETPEEHNAVRLAQRLLSGTDYAQWIPVVSDAILSCYLDGEATSDIGRVVYDADCLDKLGNIGVAQFFAKKALRQQFLDDTVLMRTSVELTYAHHAPTTLKTATGRALALERSRRTRRFYTELLEEWSTIGLGAFDIVEEEIAGVVCVLVVPRGCGCGGAMAFTSDLRDAVKCRAIVVTYRCSACGAENEFSFCLPAIEGLPPRR